MTINSGDVIAVAERLQRAVERKSDEAIRVGAVRAAKAKAGTKRAGVTVMVDGGRNRAVKRIKTTVGKMADSNMLPKYLAVAVSGFALLVVDAFGSSCLDADGSSNRLTSAYEPVISSGFGPREISDRQLYGIGALREMEKRIPQELMPLFQMIVKEEVGLASGASRTLAQIGEDAGRKHKQASAYAGGMVFCVCALIHEFMRQRGFGVR